jgi:hypothetical protein
MLRPLRTSTPTLALLIAAILSGTIGSAQASGRVHPSPEAVQPLAPGDRVPSGELHTVGGDPVALRSLVQESGALLVFYRGGW